RGLITYARANPGKLNVASVQYGGSSHLALELLKLMANIDLTHVPYNGEAKALPDLLSGRIDMMFGAAGAVKQLMDKGELVVTAVSGKRRWKVAPNLPTIDESGVPGYSTTIWLTLVAPPAVPQDNLAKLNSTFNAALKSATVAKRADELGFVIVGSTFD